MSTFHENWRKYLNNSQIKENVREFVFSEQEIRQLNRSVSKIVSVAKETLGAEGAFPLISLGSLEKITLDPAQEDPTPMQMVAESEEGEPTIPPDLQQLRQKYHGPGGELEKRSPRAVKDLEKGIGHMTAGEWEESGYVIKVSHDVLEDFEAMVQETEKTGDLYVQARDWYHNIRALLDQETNDDRDSALLGLLIATYSPRAKFALNLAEAAYMFKAVQKDSEDNSELLLEYLETFAGAEKRTPGESRGFTKAHKVPNFALNLIAPQLAGYRDKDTGQMTYNDMYMWNSTIDTWMIDAFYPSLKKASTAKEWEAIKGKMMSGVVSYRYMSQLVAQEAKKLKLLPHELQAIIWVSMQIRQTGETGLGVTTEFAINQIKEAITNIKSINNDLSEIKEEFEEKSWLGLLFDEIESKGFKEAGKYLLGIKDPEGKKFVARGVRSITASGKKGEAYGYYPTPHASKTPKADPQAQIKKKLSQRAKPEKRYADPRFSELHTYYVMNEIIQMPTGKFNNLYDSIMLYLNPNFSTQMAVDYIMGRFDPKARSSREYFNENMTFSEPIFDKWFKQFLKK